MVVLSYKVFERNFGKDPSVVGRTIVLDEQPTTVMVSCHPVLPGGMEIFGYLLPSIVSLGDMYDRTFWHYGRLKPQVSTREATADLDIILKRLASSSPQNYPHQPSAEIETYADSIVWSFRPTLFLLLGGVGVLLLSLLAAMSQTCFWQEQRCGIERWRFDRAGRQSQ